MNEPDRQIKTESLTISQIMTSMKPAQIWGVLVIVFGLLSGSFGLGYKLKSSVSEAEVAKYKNTMSQFRGLQSKEKFLALYLRYMIATDKYEKSESEKDLTMKDVAASNFKKYIEEHLKRGEDAKDEIDLQGLFLGKGGTSEATVKFGYDGSVWPVPIEFGFAALSR